MNDQVAAMFWLAGFMTGVGLTLLTITAHYRDRAWRAERLVETLREDMELRITLAREESQQ